jgi:hypothetical protein
VVFVRQEGDGVSVGETVLTGTPVFLALTKQNYPDLASKSTSWLLQLARGAPASRPAAWWDRLIEPALAHFEQSFSPVLVPGQMGRTREILQRLGPLPIVPEHRDFGPWNVHLDERGELIVLDWESAELHGLPALDLVYGLAYLAFYLDGSVYSGTFVDSYRSLWRSGTVAGDVTHACMERYTTVLHIDPGMIGPLRLLTWMIHSRSEYARLLATHGPALDQERLRNSVFFRLWQEDLRLVIGDGER